MANRLVRYIVVLLVGLCCTARVYAQTDTTVTYNDSTVVDTSTSAGDNDNYNSHENASGASKFKTRQPMQQVGERKLNGQDVDALKKQNGWWYHKEEEKKAEKPSNDKKNSWNGLDPGVLSVIFWIIIISVFLLIVILYLRTFTGSSGKRIRGGGASITEVREDIFTTNFDEQVNSALAANNYRLATRLLFLRVLRTMAEKGIIIYGQDKTNMDYLFELASSGYAREFMQASRNYEYVWYGNFIPAQNQFAQIRQQLDDLNQKITN